jgi:hypothetical protein
MNIVQIESPFEVEAKICSSKYNKKVISYHFVESNHSICIDKGEIIMAQMQACERLQKQTKEYHDYILVKKEIVELKLALDFIHQ